MSFGMQVVCAHWVNGRMCLAQTVPGVFISWRTPEFFYESGNFMGTRSWKQSVVTLSAYKPALCVHTCFAITLCVFKPLGFRFPMPDCPVCSPCLAVMLFVLVSLSGCDLCLTFAIPFCFLSLHCLPCGFLNTACLGLHFCCLNFVTLPEVIWLWLNAFFNHTTWVCIVCIRVLCPVLDRVVVFPPTVQRHAGMGNWKCNISHRFECERGWVCLSAGIGPSPLWTWTG